MQPVVLDVNVLVTQPEPHVRSRRVVVLSSMHEALDPRIFHKEARTLAAADFGVHLFAGHDRNAARLDHALAGEQGGRVGALSDVGQMPTASRIVLPE